MSTEHCAMPASYSGVIPSLALGAELGPPRSECGIGVLMAWAGKLWASTYLSAKRFSGSGTGLYEIDEQLRMTKRPESVTGTYANRYIHYPSNQLIMGPYVIDAERNVRVIEPLCDVRLTGTATHLHEPERLVYLLGMEGEFFEMDVRTLEVTSLGNIGDQLKADPAYEVHFKNAYTACGRLIVVDNMYEKEDFSRVPTQGLLAEWDGSTWKVLERAPFVEVNGRDTFCNAVFATGWDTASAILKVYTPDDGTWRTYRLPKASHCFDHGWQTEWPRIRETEHERLLMDCHGMFYELSPWAYGNRIWGIRPISTHLWVLGDFCTYRGMLVMGADNASPAEGANVLTGEPVSGLWFGKTDDLWQFGKPSGWGGPWWDTSVRAGEASDPYLMTGFEHKCLHLTHNATQPVTFTVTVDFRGDGHYGRYADFTVDAGGYGYHAFPEGFSAHWVRITADSDCVATAQLTYT